MVASAWRDPNFLGSQLKENPSGWDFHMSGTTQALATEHRLYIDAGTGSTHCAEAPHPTRQRVQ
jgi:hypothetical protein